MKITPHQLHVRLLLVGTAALLLFGCSIFNGLGGNSNSDMRPVLSITMKNAYQGVGDGNVEGVPLPENSAYITLEICVENDSAIDQSVQLQNVFIIPEDHKQIFPVALGSLVATHRSARWPEVFTSFPGNEQIFPVAVGYDQAEAFSWLGPIVEPIGGKRIAHKYYFFVIQSHEVMRIPAYQSLGCRTSFQYKSLALLFIVPKETAGEPYILHFFDGEIRFVAKRNLPISEGVRWAVGLGLFLILIVIAGFVLRKKKAKTQISLASRPVDRDE